MKRIYCRLLTAILLMGMLCGCRSYEDISVILGAEVDAAEVIAEVDTHGGFHGDGVRYIEFAFADEAFLQKIQADHTWHSLPAQEAEIAALLYGGEVDGISYGAMITDADGAPLLPIVENGYYLFYDRRAEAETPFESEGVLGRSSLNLTIALYDTETNRLYYAELDT